MKIKRIRHYIALAFSIIILIFISFLIASNIYIPFAEKEISKNISILLITNTVIISIILLLLIYSTISQSIIYKQNKVLRRLRIKMTRITAENNIVIMQYNVKEKCFIRWNDKDGVPSKFFSLEEYLSRIYPDDLVVSQKLIEYMNSQTINTYSCDYRYKIPDSNVYTWYINDVFPYKMDRQGKVISYMGICHKNDKWHELNNNLELYRKRVSFALSSADICFIQYDVVSGTFYQLDEKGELPDSPIELKISEAIHPDDLPLAKRLFKQMEEHQLEKFSIEFRLRLPGSDVYTWYATRVIAYSHDEKHQISSYMCVNINNDNWHKLMEQATELNTKAEMVKLVSNFLENMSHKILTPLNAVVGFSDVISDEESKETKDEYKKIINENSAMLLKMSNDILTFANIESGRQLWMPLSFDIELFFTSLVDNIKKTIRPDIHFLLQSNSSSFKVMLDSSMLERIISSLFNFMIGFTKEGNISVKYSNKDSGLFVVISDPSFFIEERYHESLFDRFDNFDKSSKYISGLGLPICKALIIKDNGKIGIHSNIKMGTSFWFWIPCSISKQQ